MGNMVAFEAINGVRLEVRASTGDHRGRADLLVTVIAHDRKVEIGEAPSLASVKLTASATRLRTMEALLIHALYVLDSQLVDVELAKTVPK